MRYSIQIFIWCSEWGQLILQTLCPLLLIPGLWMRYIKCVAYLISGQRAPGKFTQQAVRERICNLLHIHDDVMQISTALVICEGNQRGLKFQYRGALFMSMSWHEQSVEKRVVFPLLLNVIMLMQYHSCISAKLSVFDAPSTKRANY